MIQRNDIIVIVFVVLVLAAVGFLWITDGSQPKHEDSHADEETHGETEEHAETETVHAMRFFELKHFNHAF